ncbi:MAG TPA: D-2-hydroxyacid dehydrogenase [Steroidobacteraceae bacterium]|jgi:phosphoglycerate dehydrogenase-like enzyme
MRAKWIWAALAALAAAGAAAQEQPGAAGGVIEHYGLEQAATPVSQRPGWRKPKRILVGTFVPGLAEALQPSAPDIEFIVARPGDIAKLAPKADAVIGFCTPELLAAGKNIRWIQLVTAGVESCVSIPAVRERDILVTNMQRIGGPIIAEHVLAMVLGFTRGIDLYVLAKERGEWGRVTPPGRMEVIDGKTLLVVGLGGIGSEVAKRAHALGMKVIATRASGRTGPEFVSYVGLPDELPKLASGADFVVNTAPLTPQTTGIFDAAFFAKMKPSAYFINVARGRSVVTAALVEALNSKKIAGAGLDVTDPEPLPPDHPLWKTPNVIITPHVANDSDLGYDAQMKVVQENLRRYVAGEPMLSVVDVSKGY